MREDYKSVHWLLACVDSRADNIFRKDCVEMEQVMHQLVESLSVAGVLGLVNCF